MICPLDDKPKILRPVADVSDPRIVISENGPSLRSTAYPAAVGATARAVAGATAVAAILASAFACPLAGIITARIASTGTAAGTILLDVSLMGLAWERYLTDGYRSHYRKNLFGCALEKFPSRL